MLSGCRNGQLGEGVKKDAKVKNQCSYLQSSFTFMRSFSTTDIDASGDHQSSLPGKCLASPFL